MVHVSVARLAAGRDLVGVSCQLSTGGLGEGPQVGRGRRWGGGGAGWTRAEGTRVSGLGGACGR